jgi:Transposase C of IS166 homeodomain
MILAQREQLVLARSEVTVGRLEIERLKLMLAKARREQFGQSSERGKLLVEQLELAIEDLEETQAEQEAKAEIAAPEAARQRAQTPRPSRRLRPDNLPIERIVEPAPCACDKCGSERLHISTQRCGRGQGRLPTSSIHRLKLGRSRGGLLRPALPVWLAVRFRSYVVPWMRVSISLRRSTKSIGLVSKASAPPSRALRLVSASP